MRRRLVSRLLYLIDGLGRRRGAPDEGTAADPTDEPRDAALPPRPEGTVLWMHAPVAGDAGPLLALTQELSRLRGEPVHALLTTSKGRVPDAVRPGAIIQPAPQDGGAPVRAFFDHFRPDLGLVLGLPDRPALIAEARARHLPLFLAFARRGLAERRLPMLPASLLHHFDTCLAPSGHDARLLRDHLPDPARVVTTGPFSDTALALPCDERELSRLSQMIASRPVWLVHHPHPAEYAAIEAAHRFAARSAHRLLLVVLPAPGHDPAGLAEHFETHGWRTLRAADSDPLPEVQVFVGGSEDLSPADEDEIWYRLSPIVFCGGTIEGPQVSDPFRAAAHGTAIIHGPNTGPDPARFARLAEAGAVRAIAAPDDLGPAVTALLSPDLAATLALQGWSVISESAHVIDRMARMMDEALDSAAAATPVEPA